MVRTAVLRTVMRVHGQGSLTVTLNITLAMRHRIFQTSDFRLLDADTGTVAPEPSGKAAYLLYDTFNGLLTYTGIARALRRDTMDQVLRWLETIGERPLAGVLAGIADHATQWLVRIQRSTGRVYPLTIVVAAFDRGAAIVAVASNVESVADQRANAPTPTCSVSMKRVRDMPFVLVTGQRRAVSRADRRRLQRAADEYRQRPEAIRRELSNTNRRAAESSHAISTDCSVMSLTPDGHAAQILTDAQAIRVYTVSSGTAFPDMVDALRSVGMDTTNAKIVQSFAATTTAVHSASVRPPCLVPALPGDDASYTMTVLERSIDSDSQCVDIADDGTIFGVRWKAHPPRRDWWTWSHTSGHRVLRTPDGTTSVARRNGCGHMAGTISDDAHGAALFVSDGGAVRRLDTLGFGGRIRKLSDQNVAVGSVSVSDSSERRGQLGERPAIWMPDGSATFLLTDDPTTWGEAIDVNADGIVLLWLHRGFVDNVAAVWSADDGLVVLPRDGELTLVPVGIFDTAVVVGIGFDPEGRRVPLFVDGADVKPVRIPHGWEPTTSNGAGWIAGATSDGGPWSRAPSGAAFVAARLADHWCRPNAINAHGDFVGSSTASCGTHATIWTGAHR